ncbi:MAG: peroxiredoxin [Paracoccaceae bacterium]
MSLTPGSRLPEANLLTMGENGVESVALSDRLRGRKVILFALPGAFTGTCSTAHIPSFIRTADQLRAKGVDELICLSVNDPFTMKAWADATGAAKAGITHLADADASFSMSLGVTFTNPKTGLINRSSRYALILDDGVITHAAVEKPGECGISTGEALLELL